MQRSSTDKTKHMKNPTLKRIFFFLVILVFILPLPLLFAKGRPAGSLSSISIGTADSSVIPGNNKGATRSSVLYEDLQLDQRGLSRQAFEYALQGFEYLRQNGEIENQDVISIVDFSLPSSARRLFVIDLNSQKILYNTYVAHGNRSGREYASQFSNKPQSNKSSLGFYKTLSTYMGGHGYSLKLEGLERGINDNANRRAIVVHGAAYVSEGLVNAQGYIGRSLGCPALPEKLHKPIIDKIKDGSCLFIFAPDRNYLVSSRILKEVVM